MYPFMGTNVATSGVNGLPGRCAPSYVLCRRRCRGQRSLERIEQLGWLFGTTLLGRRRLRLWVRPERRFPRRPGSFRRHVGGRAFQSAEPGLLLGGRGSWMVGAVGCPAGEVGGGVAVAADGPVRNANAQARRAGSRPGDARSRSAGAVRMPKRSRKACTAACIPHIPCTPGPGGVADEHR